jgi:hypothetical protein
MRVDGIRDESGEVLEPEVDHADVANEIAGHLLADGLDGAGRADREQNLGGTRSGQVGVGSTGRQVAQQRVQLVDQPRAVGDEVRTLLVQQAQRAGKVLSGNRARVTSQRGNTGRGGRVDHIVLAAAAPRQLANPGRGRARHVVNLFRAGDEPLRQMPAQAAGVLHCPPPLSEPGRPPQQPSIPGQ